MKKDYECAMIQFTNWKEKMHNADLAVELLEREQRERKELMEQMATREQSSQLALESLQKQLREKEEQLQSVENELNHHRVSWNTEGNEVVATPCAGSHLQGNTSQSLISEENVFLRQQYHTLSRSLEVVTEKATEIDRRNKDLRRNLRVKDSELKKLSWQFVEYQKQRICILSRAVIILKQRDNKEFHQL